MSKKEIIEKFARGPNDTGSAEVQCAILSSRINAMTQHLRQNPKDHQSKHGLVRMVNARRRLLAYLKKGHGDRYAVLIETLGLRR